MVELLVDVEQLVAQRGKDDAADEGAGQRRIEDVRIFGEPEAQRLAERRRRGQAGQDREHRADAANPIVEVIRVSRAASRGVRDGRS